jgi:hypothetical protein
MCNNSAGKVEDESDARSHAQGRPPDAKNEPQCATKLTSCQQRKVLHWHAYEFMDDTHNAWIMAKLSETGKDQYRRENDR